MLFVPGLDNYQRYMHLGRSFTEPNYVLLFSNLTKLELKTERNKSFRSIKIKQTLAISFTWDFYPDLLSTFGSVFNSFCCRLAKDIEVSAAITPDQNKAFIYKLSPLNLSRALNEKSSFIYMN